MQNIASLGANTVFAHVRPFGDALYPSRYFPFSHLCTGTQGQDPGFDPLAVLLETAHDQGLTLESTGLADGCGVVDGPNTAGIMKRNDIRKNTPKVDKNMRMIPPLCRFAIHPSICAENENKCWQAGKIVIY